MGNNQSEMLNLFASMLNSGEDKEKLKNNVLSQLNKDQTNQLKNIMNDRNKINEILSSPAAQQIIMKLNGNGNGQHK